MSTWAGREKKNSCEQTDVSLDTQWISRKARIDRKLTYTGNEVNKENLNSNSKILKGSHFLLTTKFMIQVHKSNMLFGMHSRMSNTSFFDVLSKLF